MKFRTTVIMTVLLIVAAVFYYFDSQQRTKKQEQETTAKKVFAVEQSTITGLTIERDAESMQLEKRDKKWFFVQPVEAPADTYMIDSIIDTLTDTNRQKEIASPQDLNDYGLAEPRLKVAIHGASDQDPPALYLGAPNFSGTEIYAKFENQSELVTLSDIVRTRIDKSLFELRDKSVLPFSVTAVKKFSIASSEGEVVAEKGDDDQWFLNGDRRLRGDSNKIEELLRIVSNAKVSNFVDDKPQDLSVYGLTQPSRVFKVWLDGETTEHTLAIGLSVSKPEPAVETSDPAVPGEEAVDEEFNFEDEFDSEDEPDSTAEDQAGVYAKTGDLNNVLEISASLLDRLVPYQARLRDTHILVFERPAIHKIELTKLGDPPIICVRSDESQWSLVEPIAAKADSGEIATLLTDLENAKALGLSDDPSDLTRFNLDQPYCRITLSEVSDANPKTVLIGGLATEEGVEYRYLKQTDSPTVYKLKPDTAEQFCRPLIKLRDKRIMDYVKSDLRTLLVKGPKGEAEVTSSDGRTFKGKLVGGRELDETEVNNLIWSCDYIEAKDILAEGDALDLAGFGLDQPFVKADITLKDKPGQRLLISRFLPEQNGHAVMLDQGKMIGLADAATFEDLLKMDIICNGEQLTSDQ